ncbi:MAG TPA: tRNA 2-thiocytidine(32) synthetase TtcA [Candidatus Margulisbacteria bacterium]|nr:MAG: hypothetical protein A2X41_08810 [Candidatus Margulisbacteria bacterium GWE2_39_32]HCT84930.1 tRNA 2-thiocytidine(32) synthetase TtcA [Candidatus Margulisiibacteriota bacterium]
MKNVRDKIIRSAGKAVADFGLIKDGDNILVGLSGGKDSYTMVDVLLALQKKAPIQFSLTGITIDSGFEGFKGETIEYYCKEKKVPFIYKKADILNIIKEHKNPRKSVCSFCARLRRGALYTFAAEHGYNKIALGHHADDFIETVLMNMFYSGSLKAMAPYHVADDKRNIVIRPLVYVFEEDIITYALQKKFPIICCVCPVSKGAESKRNRVKRLLRELQEETPHIKSNILNSLSNVAYSHLLAQKAVVGIVG